MARIYVASSWRNEQQPIVVNQLRDAGHKVYDFRNPPKNSSFKWSDIDPNWQNWTYEEYIKNLWHPLAQSGFNSDLEGMRWAEYGLLVLPAGKSSHLKLGWMAGQNKVTIVLTKNNQEPELMYLLSDYICTSMDEVLQHLL